MKLAGRALARIHRRGSFALPLVVAAAAGARLAGIDFGLPALLDPDELMFELASYRQIANGTANPGWFGHPATTTVYALTITNALVFVLGWLSHSFAGFGDFAEAIFADPGLLILPGRLLIVAFSLWCVVLVYRLALELFDRRSAVVAAALVALSPVLVSWSQVIRSDVMATAFMLCAMLYSLDFLRQQRTRSLVLASLLVGVATATKWPFAITIVSIFAAILAAHRGWRNGLQTVGRKMALAGAVMLASLLVISPFLVLDFSTVMENLQGEAQQDHVGANGFGLAGNIWFYVSQPLLAALGPLGLAASLAGAAMVRRAREWWIIAGIPLIFFLFLISSQNLVWERWVVPLVTIMAISAGAALARGLSQLDKILARRASLWLVNIAVVVAIFAPLLSGISERYRMRIADPRAAATAWASQNLPRGSSLMVEHFAFDLQSTSFSVLFPVGTAGCLDARELLAGRIDYAFIDSLRGGNSNLDYAAVPPSMLDSCEADYAIVSEYSRYLAEAERYPEKVATYRDLIESSQVVHVFEAVSPADPRARVYLLRTRQPIPVAAH